MRISIYESHQCKHNLLTICMNEFIIESYPTWSYLWCQRIYGYDNDEIAHKAFLLLHEKNDERSSVVVTLDVDEGDAINDKTILKLNEEYLTSIDKNGNIRTMVLGEFLYDNVIHVSAVQKYSK